MILFFKLLFLNFLNLISFLIFSLTLDSIHGIQCLGLLEKEENVQKGIV
jgi:hypothetical protein